jgi:hypothetical protein
MTRGLNWRLSWNAVAPGAVLIEFALGEKSAGPPALVTRPSPYGCSVNWPPPRSAGGRQVSNIRQEELHIFRRSYAGRERVGRSGIRLTQAVARVSVHVDDGSEGRLVGLKVSGDRVRTVVVVAVVVT